MEGMGWGGPWDGEGKTVEGIVGGGGSEGGE